MTTSEETVTVSPRLLSDLKLRATTQHLVDIAYTTVDTPVGRLLLAATQVGLVRIAFLDHEHNDEVLAELATKVSPRVLESPSRLQDVLSQLDEYFNRSLQRFDIPIDWSLSGTFARRVLRRTSRIPYGQVATYSDIAEHLGAPGAARAVGNALAGNPIPVIVPCHRVLRRGGSIGGYGGGPDRKEWLLTLEGAIAAA